ncbi:MAG: hypothetical protein ABSC19_19090 [Syntrophorhabdales bacterium]|jgi:hypothetical protein
MGPWHVPGYFRGRHNGAFPGSLFHRQFYVRSRGNYYKAFTIDSTPLYVHVTFPELTGNDSAQAEQSFHDGS